MSDFLDKEKRRQIGFKRRSSYFSESARTEGIYKKKLRPFCLPLECAAENLFEEIREDAIRYFATHNIVWHDGTGGNPSNHLCDSQVCCVNFLFPFVDKPDALVALLQPLFPDISRVLPMENDGDFISFEWIGLENYLGEKIAGKGKRTRGSFCTSADAAVMFETKSNVRNIALIEWKYTESYSSSSLATGNKGTTRLKIYQPFYESNDSIFDKTILKDFTDLFYEPFYQLMRLQLLASEMGKAHELGADVVSLIHIVPGKNRNFHENVSSPALRHLGPVVNIVWKRLLCESWRFYPSHTEWLFGSFFARKYYAELEGWYDYVNQRYQLV